VNRANKIGLLLVWFALLLSTAVCGESWHQYQGNALRSGHIASAELPESISLLASIETTDAILASPAIEGDWIYVVDASGVAHGVDAKSFQTKWTFTSRGGTGNCNNVSSPAIVGDCLHFGTMAGYYYVLDRFSGTLIKEIDCRDPILASPCVGKDRVYFATLGACLYALEPKGEVIWTWDFVKEEIGFQGDRWNGQDWLAERKGRVTWRDHFVCSREICLIDSTVVMPAGGRTVFLQDLGDKAAVRTIGLIPDFSGNEYPATFGQSADETGNVFVQWHRRDNAGRVEVLRFEEDKLNATYVPGTQTAIELPGLLSFASVAVRNHEVFRVKPENGQGLVLHNRINGSSQILAVHPAISPPVVTKDHVLYGGLDGSLHTVHLGTGKSQVYSTRSTLPISGAIAICNQRIYVPSEDGHLYVFGQGNVDDTPFHSLDVHHIRSPLQGPYAGSEFNWYTNYGDFGCTNANQQGLAPPLRMRWARRLEGTVKHLPVCGGGRMYVHTAEGQVIAVEQDTGRQLWRRYFPDVYLSFTSPLYIGEKLLVPQAGLKKSMLRCLDAATGELLWESPFTGSPSWSRQFPPVVHENVAIYASGSGEYAAQGTEKPFTFTGQPKPTDDGREVMSWIYSNDNPYYPKDNRPLLWAWDVNTGKLLWTKDFSEYGRGGNDCGLCLVDSKLFYSTFFGYSASQRARRGLPVANNGITACLDPKTGDVKWLTNEYYVTAKCTLSGRDGRLYIGGNNQASEASNDRFVWCLNASDGSLVWKSDPITSALNVVSVGKQFLFSNALRGRGNVFDRETGDVVGGVEHKYACCRFTMSEPYILGANMDMIDLSKNSELVSTGPAIDSRECLGAVVSNGRIFYISQASGFMVSQTYGDSSQSLPAPWARPSSAD
jgi:outer membrane protein assembly factor BamB